VEEQVVPAEERSIVENVQQPKVTVGFERSVSVRPYETAKASVFIQAEVPIGYTAKELEQGLRDAMFQAKAQVFEQLGIEFEINEHGVIMELLQKSFGPVDIVKEDATASASSIQSNGNGALVCGNDASHKMWDNRAKKASGEYKATAPDGKCSQCDFKAWPAKKA
jgi:hypothetical protein